MPHVPDEATPEMVEAATNALREWRQTLGRDEWIERSRMVNGKWFRGSATEEEKHAIRYRAMVKAAPVVVEPSWLAHAGWVSTLAQVVGVFILSTRTGPPAAAFAVMLLGSCGWMAISGMRREWSIFTLNLAFTISNLIGIWRWLHP